ncbi:DUF5801 repeats-in-toxin domain-containing protein, partial [Kiloniella majae]|uniref:DUF5801 repeats-in-toxin domain-containing protein n=1 Tax=Kiloniella majae TaxID=1938558 RepID=UPI001C3F9F54
ISDPDTGEVATLPVTVVAVIDAAADKPVFVGEGPDAEDFAVGYYDMKSSGRGGQQQMDAFQDVGTTLVKVEDLTPEELAELDVLVVANRDNRGYSNEYIANLDNVREAIANGLVLVINDQFVDDAETILPDGAGFNIIRDFTASKNIDVANPDSVLVTASTDTVLDDITDETLDGGHSSNHGFAVVSSLGDAEILLNNGDDQQAVAFSYSVGEGTVYYSTIPLAHFQSKFGGYPDNNFATTYAKNLIKYALAKAREGKGKNITQNEEYPENVEIPVEVRFDDFADDSEVHEIILSGIPSDWVLQNYTDIASEPIVDPENPGFVSYVFAVSDLVDVSAGDLNIKIEFDPLDWTSSRLDNGNENSNGSAEVTITARATETTVSGEELSTENDVSETSQTIKIDIVEDIPEVDSAALVHDETDDKDDDANDIASVSTTLKSLLADSFNKLPDYDEVVEPVARIDDEPVQPDAVKSPGELIGAATTEIVAKFFSDGPNKTGDRLDDSSVDDTDFGKERLEFKSYNDVPTEIFQGNPTVIETTDGRAVYLQTDSINPNIVWGLTAEGEAVFAVHLEQPSVDNSTGLTATFVQYQSVKNLNAGTDAEGFHDEITSALKLEFRTLDDEGDPSDYATLSITIEDDGSTIESDNAQVVIDDDNVPGADGNPGGIGDDAPANTTGTLSHNYGADEEGATTLLLDTGAPAGFTYEVNDDGTILTVKQDGVDVMSITLDDTTSGNYTVTQLNPIKHPEGSDENNVEFVFNYRVTDGDKDTVDGTLSVSVDDDTPVVDDGGFKVIKEKRLDGDVENASVNGCLDINFGADGGSVTGIEFKGWTDLDAGSRGDANPSDTPDAEIAELKSNGKLISFSAPAFIGDPALMTTIGTTPDGTEIIRVQIDPTFGDYDVILSGPVDHPDVAYDHRSDDIPDGVDADDNDDPIGLHFEYTVTDGDGDTTSAGLFVGIEDDEVDSGSVRVGQNNRSEWKVIDEATLDDKIAGNSFISGELEFDFGADGGYLDDIYFEETKDTEDDDEAPEDALTSGGDDVAFGPATDDGAGNMVLVGKNSVTGEEVIVVTINKITGAYTVELKAPIDHEDTGSGNDNGDPLTIGFRYVTYDNDGDQDISRLEIVIEDDLPSVVGTVSDVTDESSLPGDWATATGNIAADFGADGGEFTAITLEGFTDIAGNPIDLADLSSGGNSVTVHQTVSDDGKSLVLVGSADGKAVFDIYLNKETGDYAYRQYGGGLDHKGDKGIGDTLKLVFGYEVTDGDDDTATGNLVIEASDSEVVAVLDEDHSFNGEAVSGNVLDNDTVGADGASVISYTFEGKTYDVSGALIINGVGQFYLKPDGSYKFYPEGNPDQNKQIEFGYTIKDGDGDEASSKLVIDIEDAVPTAGNEYAGHIRESNIAAGTAKQSGTLEGDFGADGAGSFAIADLQLAVDADYDKGTPVALTSGGEAVTFGAPVEVNGLMVITGVAAIGDDGKNEDVLTLSVNPATGRYEIVLLKPIDHPDTARSDISDQVELTFKVVVTDADGTTAEGALRFRISDDAPVAIDDTGEAVAAGEDLGEARGNVLDNDQAGADGDAWVNSVTFNGAKITLTKENTSSQAIAGTYGTLYISSEGRYRYEPFEDAGTLPDGPVVDEFSYTITDKDGDVSSPAHLSIEVKGLLTTDTELYQAAGWNAPGEKAVSVDTAVHKTVTVRDFVEASVDYSADADEEINLVVQNAKRGDITLGDKDDVLVVTNSTNSAGSTTYPAHFAIKAGDGNDKIFINEGEVRQGPPHTTDALIVDGSLTTTNVDLGDGDDFYENQTDSADHVTAGIGNDTIKVGGGIDVVYGGEGEDHIEGGNGNDIIFGGDDDDILRGGNGQDLLKGDDGDDELDGGNDKDTLFGGIGNDELEGGNGNDTLLGGIGNDELSGGNDNDYLYGEEDNDTLEGGNGLDQLFGGSGSDYLSGGNGNDFLYGQDGEDILIGGNDDDTLIGGDDADTFVFSLRGTDQGGLFGQDVVTDFNAAEDVLKFTDVIDTGASDLDIDDLNAAISSVTDNGAGNDVVVNFNNGSSITFEQMGTAGSTIDSIDDLVNNPAAQIIIE